MSRQLTLTEELERLEQSITLTLQGKTEIVQQIDLTLSITLTVAQRLIQTSAEHIAS